MAFDTLLRHYEKIVVFDTETTGLDCRRDEIIQFSAAVISLANGTGQVVETYDNLVQLSPGKTVSPYISDLTGIYPEDLRDRGLSATRVCCDIANLICGRTLLVAYNAQFDLTFLYFTLLRNGDPRILTGKDKLDALTIFRDRRPYPHRLSDAIQSYQLSGKVRNSHNALDDVTATVAVLEAMEREKDDLHRYVNLFGYFAKERGNSIASITYRHRSPGKPLYEI